jgi:TetR/AcrR family transcriptional regulator of autoinduction and epiphytic fitness
VVRSREKVLRAALEELASAGYAGFAMESVAARAGVGRSTLYRHWSDRWELVTDALEVLNVQPTGQPSLPDAPRARVEQLLTHLSDVLLRPPVSGVVPALVHAAEQSEAVRDFFHAYSARRREALVTAVRAGVEAGVFREVDPELAADALSGAVFYRRLLTGRPVGAAEVPELVTTVLG